MTTGPIKRVATARQRSLKSERDLRTAIAAAFADRSTGHTVDDIAAAAGLTRQRVYQIVREMSGLRA